MIDGGAYDAQKLAAALGFELESITEYLIDCLNVGRNFVVTRLRDLPEEVATSCRKGRTIEGTGRSLAECKAKFEKCLPYEPKLIEIKPDSSIIVHRARI